MFSPRDGRRSRVGPLDCQSGHSGEEGGLVSKNLRHDSPPRIVNLTVDVGGPAVCMAGPMALRRLLSAFPATSSPTIPVVPHLNPRHCLRITDIPARRAPRKVGIAIGDGELQGIRGEPVGGCPGMSPDACRRRYESARHT